MAVLFLGPWLSELSPPELLRKECYSQRQHNFPVSLWLKNTRDTIRVVAVNNPEHGFGKHTDTLLNNIQN